MRLLSKPTVLALILIVVTVVCFGFTWKSQASDSVDPRPPSPAASFGGDFEPSAVGVCADTGSTCAIDDDCEGACTLTSHQCIADGDCPTGLCSGTGAACAVRTDCPPGACSITTATSCHRDGDCPQAACSGSGEFCLGDLMCPPGTCSASGGPCHEDGECPTRACSGNNATCGVDAHCPVGSCSITTATSCHADSECPQATCSASGGQCDVDTDCPAGSCSGSAAECWLDTECPAGTCTLTGGSCRVTGDCPTEGRCDRTNLTCTGSCTDVCDGGPFTNNTCSTSSNCHWCSSNASHCSNPGGCCHYILQCSTGGGCAAAGQSCGLFGVCQELCVGVCQGVSCVSQDCNLQQCSGAQTCSGAESCQVQNETCNGGETCDGTGLCDNVPSPCSDSGDCLGFCSGGLFNGVPCSSDNSCYYCSSWPVPCNPPGSLCGMPGFYGTCLAATCVFGNCIGQTCDGAETCDGDSETCEGDESCLPTGPQSCEEGSNVCLLVNPPQAAASPYDFRKNRYLAFDANNPDTPVAIRVQWLERICANTGRDCSYDADCGFCIFDISPCHTNEDCQGGGGFCFPASCYTLVADDIGWVGEVCEIPADTQVPADTYTGLVVPDMPALQLFPPVTFVTDCEIQPRRSYALSATADGLVFSDPLIIGTILEPYKNAKYWADVVGQRDADTGDYTEPNQRINVDDVSVMIVFLNSKSYRPHLTVLDLSHEVPGYKINADDLQMVMRAFGITEDYPPLKFQVEASGAMYPVLCPPDLPGARHEKCP